MYEYDGAVRGLLVDNALSAFCLFSTVVIYKHTYSHIFVKILSVDAWYIHIVHIIATYT